MRFEEAYGCWLENRLTQEEAALILGVSDRTFRRYIDRFEKSGLDGLADKRRQRNCPSLAKNKDAPGYASATLS